MKIVHVIISSAYYNENLAYQDNLLPKYHRKAGHEVTVIAPPYDHIENETIYCNWKEKLLNDGVKVIRLKAMLPCSINQHIHLFKGLYRAIENEHPDLLFVHSVVSPNYISLARYKKRHPSVSIVFDNHADFNNSCKTRASLLWTKLFVNRFIIGKIVNLSNSFYGVTPARCLFLNTMYHIPKEKIRLLPMGADDESMEIHNKKYIRSEIRRKYEIDDNDFLIVTGGKIDKLKNIHTLMRAINRIDNDHIKLLVFGSIDNEIKPLFDSELSGNIVYIGWIDSSKVYEYFYAADLVMFPGLHSVLWEQAVASRVPCAVTKLEGFEHVNNNNNCILLENNTAEYYQSVITHLIENDEYYNLLKENADSNKADEFLYSRIAQKVIDENWVK